MKYKRRRSVAQSYFCSQEVLKKKQALFIESMEDVDITRVISIDETGFISTNTPMFGYSKSKLVSKPSFSIKRQKRSCVMATTTNGVLCHDVFEDNVCKDTFVAFFKNMLSNLPMGKDIVVMDNISFHHSQEIKRFADSFKVRIIYSPPYSPQFNPIEHVFSLLKRSYRNKLNDGVPFTQAIKQSIDGIEKAYKDMTNIFIHSLINECLNQKKS
jgi:transposase